MTIEEQIADFRVLVTQELGEIKGDLRLLTESVQHWATHTKIQNGRIAAIETWIEQRKIELAHAAGVVLGREELRRKDLLVIGGVVGGVSTLVTIAVQIGIPDLIQKIWG